MSLKQILLLAALAGFSLIACNSSSTAPAVDNVALLQAHSWKLSAATAAPPVIRSGVQITNIYDSLFDDCFRSLTLTFKSKDTVLLHLDSALCNGAIDNIDTWSIRSDTITQIYNDGYSADTTKYTLVSVSETTLRMTLVTTFPGELSPGVDTLEHTATMIYTAQ